MNNIQNSVIELNTPKPKPGADPKTQPKPQPKGLIGTSARAFNNISPSPIIRNPEEKRNMLSALSTGDTTVSEDKKKKKKWNPAPPRKKSTPKLPKPNKKTKSTLVDEETSIINGKGKGKKPKEWDKSGRGTNRPGQGKTKRDKNVRPPNRK